MINSNEILELLIFTQSKDNHSNLKDIRSITVNALFEQIENLNIAIILSRQINDLTFLKTEISESITEESIDDILYNYEGFVKDAYFIKSFIIVENHINQIAEFYETAESKIKHHSSILSTFENLIKKEKCELFSDLSDYEINLFRFYCWLRNTNHKIGFQSKEDKSLVINDKYSVININEVKLELKNGEGNNLDTNSLLLLHEQIIKLIIKINSKIPADEYIEHILANNYN